MCGIAGVLDPTRSTSFDDLADLADSMARTLAHRGPDDQGMWVDESAGVALAFRRLSIIDLSPHGRQPMESANGRYVVVFNGEIYNFRHLRKELEDRGHRFRGESDTEVLLAGVVEWGIPQALHRFNGMFALAIWDRQAKALTLARDRMGEKPLFYGKAGNHIVFASELKALRAHAGFRPSISREALALYLRHNCIPAPWSIYEGIGKLPPATMVRLSTRDRYCGDPVGYWQLADHARTSTERSASPEEVATEELDMLLRDSVRLRMIADVPLGAFLSGGIDSSTVVAMMQAQSSLPVKTFTIGFSQSEYNEAEQAKAVATHLGTDHTELYVTPQEALDVVPLLPTMYDEPFADSSQIPTFLVSQLARRNVTVSLSGDGGDEIFGGYNRYLWGAQISRALNSVPLPFRQKLGARLASVKPSFWDTTAARLDGVLPARLRHRSIADKVQKLSNAMQAPDEAGLYRQLISHWDPATILIDGDEPRTTLMQHAAWSSLDDFRETMMYLDAVTYLPDDILVKLDRASMAVSLEARVPMLDHRVVEFAWNLPVDQKIRGRRGKHLLRRVLDRYVPRELVERPKTGFGVPIDSWLRGPLRDWAETLLHEHRLQSEGYFNPAVVQKRWRDHLAGRRNYQYHLWDVLMFQAWLDSAT